VIGKDGSLTGYAGGLERKRWLLDHEKNHCWRTDLLTKPCLNVPSFMNTSRLCHGNVISFYRAWNAL
jgi:hypothetical protein